MVIQTNCQRLTIDLSESEKLLGEAESQGAPKFSWDLPPGTPTVAHGKESRKISGKEKGE